VVISPLLPILVWSATNLAAAEGGSLYGWHVGKQTLLLSLWVPFLMMLKKIFHTKHVFVDVGVSLISDCVNYAGIAMNTICIVSMSMNLIMFFPLVLILLTLLH
jgi:hypothetical protein